MEKLIDCTKLEIMRDIPVELSALQAERKRLINLNRILSIGLAAIGIGITIYSIMTLSENSDDNNRYKEKA